MAVKDNVAVKKLIWILRFCQTNWFFVALGVFIALAHSYPSFAKQGGTIKAEYSIGYGAVAVIFLISGLSMSTHDLMVNMMNWRAHITVLGLSFLITSSIIFGICCGIKSANNGNIDEWLLVGMIVTHCCPTTVSSNVVMTKAAKGNDILTLCEVFIGNILGAFITPALVQMFTSNDTWAFGNPAKDSSVTDLYRQVMKQLGLSVFIPLFVGQVVQNVFPKQTKWTLTTFKLSKVGSFMLVLIIYESFSTAFAQNAFTSVSHVSIIFLVFFNIGIYLFFTLLCFMCARCPLIPMFLSKEPSDETSKAYNIAYKMFRPFYYNRKDTVSVMLCGAAKTAALGVSLLTSQYGEGNDNIGILLVPLVLYQSEQVMTAQVLVKLFKMWIEAEDDAQQDIEQQNESVADDSESAKKESEEQ